MTTDSHGDGLVDVVLRGLPVDLYVAASEHTDDLLREIALIEADPASAPARLLALSTELRSRFIAFTAAPQSTVDDAVAAGEAAIDLTYRLPPDAGEASRRLASLLVEADAYCRRERLLTPAAPPKVAAFLQWFLGEFAAQTAGDPPTAWPDWVAAS